MILGYGRVSTLDQARPDSASITEQLRRCRAVADMRGQNTKYDFANFVDRGVSGSVPLYHRLPWELRSEFQDKMLSFIDGKHFRPGGSLDEITDEQRVIIAAHACLPLMNRDSAGCHGGILGVHLFADTPPEKALESATPSHPALLWDQSLRACLDPHNASSNLVLSILNRLGANPPITPSGPDLRLTAWGRVLSSDLHNSFGFQISGDYLNAYHANGDIAAFYAAATEAFFSYPSLLQQQDAGLYLRLKQFFRVDPLRWKTLTH